MERYHFDDLTKINVPFGLLDADTQERLKAWAHGWEVYIWCKDVWKKCNIPIHINRGIVYRAKPAPLTKPHVPDDVWRVLPDWVAGVGKDRYDDIYALSANATTECSVWVGSNRAHIGWLKGVTPGTCDWRDSWVPKPEKR